MNQVSQPSRSVAGSTIGKRIREERLRLEMTQQELVAAGGFQADAQYKYESSIRFPKADYLAGVAEDGADVSYIITGKRSIL